MKSFRNKNHREIVNKQWMNLFTLRNGVSLTRSRFLYTCGLFSLNLSSSQENSRVCAPLLARGSCWPHISSFQICFRDVDRVARLSFLQPNFRHLAEFKLIGRVIFGLAVWLFFRRFHRCLAEIFFCWPFLKIFPYFKANLSTTTPFFKVPTFACMFDLVQ